MAVAATHLHRQERSEAAWPADGRADLEVLTSLADDGGIGTVVLSSGELPSSVGQDAEDALARTTSGVGTNMSVLLANSRITSLLGTASATATQAGQFAFTQDFLAQTAMMRRAPTSRSLVVAPPPGWDPSPSEANALLSITHAAPWLHSVDLSTLAAAAAKLPSSTHIPAKRERPLSVSDTYHRPLTRSSLALFKDLLYQPTAQQDNALAAALAVTESSAWRGAGSPGGWLALTQLGQYLSDSEHKVQMIASKKILLAGQSGKTAVSVLNGLSVPVQVRWWRRLRCGQLQVGAFSVLKVQAEKSNTVWIPVHSATIGPRRAATVGDTQRVAVGDGAVAERRGDAVRAGAARHYRRCAGYPRADVGFRLRREAGRRQEPGSADVRPMLEGPDDKADKAPRAAVP